MKKRILFFLKTPPPITGATLMNLRTSKSSFLNNKYFIKTINISYNKSISTFGKLNIQKYVLFFKYLRQLIIESTLFKPSIIYFQLSPSGGSFIRDSIYILTMTILLRKRVLVHLRGLGIKKSINNNSIKKKYYKYIFKKINVICLSELVTHDVKNILQKPAFIVYNGYPKISYANNIIRKKEDKIDLLFLSNLIIQKGVLDFIESINILKQKGISVRGHIIGSEGDLSIKMLIQVIKSKNLNSDINVYGYLSGIDKYKHFISSDIFIFPSYYEVETWGGVLLEAMQFSLPIISTRIGAASLLIENNINGFLVDQNAPYQIAEKVIELSRDFKKRKLFGQISRKKYLEDYTFESYIKRLDKVFINILQNE